MPVRQPTRKRAAACTDYVSCLPANRFRSALLLYLVLILPRQQFGRHESVRPQKHRRTSGDRYGRLPSLAFSITSADAYGRHHHAVFPLCKLPSSTEARARTSRLLLHGRDCGRQWLWPLRECLFPVDDATHRRCFDHDGSAAGGRVRDGRWCHCETTTGWGKARGCSGVIVNSREKEEWQSLHGGGCPLLAGAKRKKIQGDRASSLCPL